MKRLFGFFFAAMLVVCSCENMGELDDVKNPSAGGYDDTAIKEAIDNLKSRLETLEQNVADIQGMLEGTVQIKSAVEANGVWTITLSNNSVINVYPQAEEVEIPEVPQNLITVTEVDGVKYWAMYVDGEAKPVLDAQGNMIPVVTAIPEVEIPEPVAPQFKNEDGAILVSFDGGNTWNVTGYEQVETEGCECETPLFAGVEIITKEVDGEELPAYGIFYLVDGYEFTVTFDTWANWQFEFSNQSVYVAFGKETDEWSSPALYASEDFTYILQAPKGWVVELTEGEDDDYLKIIAPTREAVESGAAVASGYVKAIGVLEGGKSVAAQMELTTQYMSKISINSLAGTLYAEYNPSVQSYLIAGVAPKDEFDAETYAAAVAGMMTGESMPPKYGAMNLQEFAYYEVPISALYPALEPGVPMVFWVLPVEEVQVGWDYVYACDPDNVTVKDFALTSISVEQTVKTWNKVDIKADIKGLGNFYYKVTAAQYFNEEEFMEYELPHISCDYEMPVSFEGSISKFPENEFNTDILPGKEYVMVLVIEKDGTYTAEDVNIYRFESEPLIDGGALKPVVDTVMTTYTSLQANISAPEGAALTYYAWVNTLEDMPGLPSDKLKADYLIESGYVSQEPSIYTSISDLAQGEAWTLLAMSVDAEGQYGEVVAKDCVTDKISFRPERLTLTLSPEQITVNDTAKVTISHPAASDVKRYLYYAGTTDHSYWTNSRYYGGTRESAQNFMTLNADSPSYGYTISKLAGSDVITMTGLQVKEYVVVVVAEHNDGSFTEAAMINFKPVMNLGNFVMRDADGDGNDDEAWKSAAPELFKKTAEWYGDFCTIQYTVTVPEGMTVYAQLMHKDTPAEEGLTTPEKITEYLFANGRKCTSSYVSTVSTYYGGPGWGIYVTWCDAEGNFYEPMFVDAEVSGGSFGV